MSEIISPLLYGDGRLDTEVLIISDYLTPEDKHKGKPFSGSAGFELKKICLEAGLDWNNSFRTVAVGLAPRHGDYADLFYSTTEKKTRTLFNDCYPKSEVFQGIERLKLLIYKLYNLKLIIGVGNIPLWLFTDKASVTTSQGTKLPGGISKWRGSQLYTSRITSRPIPFLPISSPHTILKDWSLRHLTVHDVKTRAVRYLQGKAWDRPEWNFTIKPSFDIVMSHLRRWEANASLRTKEAPLELAADIETWRRQYITCIGIADDKTSICIPFFYFNAEHRMVDYFTTEQEIAVWLELRKLLSHPNVSIIGQNFIYDNQFLYRLYDINTNLGFDTMLAHHLCWPGTPKSLDHLASLYCDHYVYWKDESQDWNEAFSHESLWLYNCKDVRETYDIAQELKALILKLNFQEQWALQLAQWRLARDMMQRGVNVNTKLLQKLSLELMQTASMLEAELLQLMPEDIRYSANGTPWYTSPTQQKTIFYDMLGLAPVLHKKTKRPTLDATALPKLKESAPWLSAVFDRLEDLRSISVFRSHFLDIKLSFDQRLRCNFNVGGTETFRWSSSANGFGEGTNLQNIPKGDE